MTMPAIDSEVRWKDPRKLKGAKGLVSKYYDLPFGCENGCRESMGYDRANTLIWVIPANDCEHRGQIEENRFDKIQ